MAITVPKLLTTPFAANGAKNEIPLQAVTTPGETNLASWMLGFPPVTMMALEAGGIPPEGRDMNGVLNALSSHIVFQNAGGQYQFNAEFAQALGGYPAGVILVSDDFKSAYISLVDNNTENFNTASPITQWKAFAGQAAGNTQATESTAGIAKIATSAEVAAGTDNTTIITPATLANALKSMTSLPVGFMTMWPSPTLPADGKWMERNGDLLAVADYPELFSLVQYAYGGNGTTTFALPDDRGLVERGWDHGRGYDSARTFGSEQGDAIRNITGYANVGGLTNDTVSSMGVLFGVSFAQGRTLSEAVNSNYSLRDVHIDVSRQVPTANENRVRNRAYLPIIKVLP